MESDSVAAASVTRVLTSRLGTPRLVVRTLVATFGAILLILAAIFVVLTVETRNTASRTVTANLESTERIFNALEEQRRSRLELQLANLAGSPDLGNALFLFQTSTAPDAIALPALRIDIPGRVDCPRGFGVTRRARPSESSSSIGLPVCFASSRSLSPPCAAVPAPCSWPR